MARTLLSISGILGLGTVGYYAYRSYQRSDKSFKGAIQQMSDELQTGAKSLVTSGQRVFEALSENGTSRRSVSRRAASGRRRKANGAHSRKTRRGSPSRNRRRTTHTSQEMSAQHH